MPAALLARLPPIPKGSIGYQVSAKVADGTEDDDSSSAVISCERAIASF
jgi:hypothetical protein